MPLKSLELSGKGCVNCARHRIGHRLSIRSASRGYLRGVQCIGMSNHDFPT